MKGLKKIEKTYQCIAVTLFRCCTPQQEHRIP